jgi:hypothetical protein
MNTDRKQLCYFFLVHCKLMKHQLKGLSDFYLPNLTPDSYFPDNLRKPLPKYGIMCRETRVDGVAVSGGLGEVPIKISVCMVIRSQVCCWVAETLRWPERIQSPPSLPSSDTVGCFPGIKDHQDESSSSSVTS